MSSNRADRFWSAWLGAAVEPGRIVVAPHASLGGYAGAWLFVRGEGAVVSAPPAWVPRLRARVAGLSPGSLHRDASVERLFGDAVERRIGPTFLGCLDPGRFRPARDPRVRALGPADAAAVAALGAACDPGQRADADLRLDGPAAAGLFGDEGELLAAASLTAWGSGAVGPGVLTHPGHRGRGLGRAVVSAVCEAALGDGRLVVYQTLRANAAALAIALALGFDDYATNLAVRLRA